jgi:signal transduction histidine kinase
MAYQETTREQLICEVEILRKRNAALETLHKEHTHAREAWQTQHKLLSELLDLQERQRRSIAYEIHDGLAQQLTGALCYLEAFRGLATGNSPAATKAFETGLKLVRDAIGETRTLINGLRPAILDELGLAAAVGHLVRESEERGGPRIDYHQQLRCSSFPPLVERAAFRIVQEALTNAYRHSRSETVRVELVQEGPRLCILIQDWGIGFEPVKADSGRHGLAGIRERAKVLGGQATIDSTLGGGTRILVEIPIRDDCVHNNEPP